MSLVWASACSDSPTPLDSSLLKNPPGMKLQRMFAVHEGTETIFGGFTGAAKQPFKLQDSSGKVLAEITPDSQGRFKHRLSRQDSFELVTEGSDAPLPFTAKEIEQAHLKAVQEPLSGAGVVPNDLVFLRQRPELLVVRSGDHGLARLSLEGDALPGLRFPEQGSEPAMKAQPWFAKELPDGKVVVSAFGQHQAYVLDLEKGEILHQLKVSPVPRDGAPLPLSEAYDIDGDGQKETSLTNIYARSPQGLAVGENYLAVGFSGFIKPGLNGSAPLFIPSVVAVWSLADLAAPPRVLELEHRNVQWLSDAQEGNIWIVCSGTLALQGAKPEVLDDGAIYQLSLDSLLILQSHPLGRFAPGSMVHYHDALWVSSLVKPEVRRISMNAGDTQTISLNQDLVDSVFRLVDLGGGLLAAPSFNSDQLHIIDMETRELNPLPFQRPLAVGPGRPVFDGLQVVARRPGARGVDFLGPDLYILSGIAARIVPVSLRAFLGP